MDKYLETLRTLIIEQLNGFYFGDLLMLAVVLGFIILVPGYIIRVKKGGSYLKVVHLYLVVLYLGIILIITVFRRDAGSRPSKINTYINIGMAGGYVYSVRQVIYTILNVLLFVPYGFLASLFRREDGPIKGIIMTTLIGFLTSFFVEITQILTWTGMFEVTDIATNVCGSFLGAVLGVAVLALHRRILEKRNGFIKQEEQRQE